MRKEPKFHFSFKLEGGEEFVIAAHDSNKPTLELNVTEKNGLYYGEKRDWLPIVFKFYENKTSRKELENLIKSKKKFDCIMIILNDGKTPKELFLLYGCTGFSLTKPKLAEEDSSFTMYFNYCEKQ
jgi:hypothetical protein